MSFPKPVQYKRRLDEKILFCSIVVLFNSTSLILRMIQFSATHTAEAKKHNMQICSVCLAPFGEAKLNRFPTKGKDVRRGPGGMFLN